MKQNQFSALALIGGWNSTWPWVMRFSELIGVISWVTWLKSHDASLTTLTTNECWSFWRNGAMFSFWLHILFWCQYGSKPLMITSAPDTLEKNNYSLFFFRLVPWQKEFILCMYTSHDKERSFFLSLLYQMQN